MISVVIPVYNVEKYLRECIESILNQSYQDFEIILVDDGSKDSSGKICDEYASRHDNIQVIHKQNAGLGMARNTGIEAARGDYITFIDSDDYIDSDSFEKMRNALEIYHADACISGYKKVDDQYNVLFTGEYPFEIFEHNGVSNEVLTRMLGSSPGKHDAILMSTCTVLFNLRIIKENNLRFKSEREYISEDMIFDVDFYRYAKKCVVLEGTPYSYRYNPSSLTTTYKLDRFEKVIIYTKYLESLLEKFHFSHECFIRMYKQFFINLRVCIKQEHLATNSNSFRQSLLKIKEICNNEYVQKIIARYPCHELQIKQKIFVYLIKYRITLLLYFLVK